MLDASSKIPSGLLRGNANQFGDFDLCTEIRTKIIVKDEKSVKIKGKYCLANVDIRASDEEMKLAVHLMQGRNLLRSRIEDVSWIRMILFLGSIGQLLILISCSPVTFCPVFQR